MLPWSWYITGWINFIRDTCSEIYRICIKGE